MPHAAIFVTGAFIVGVAAYAVYKEVIEPGLERRRQEQEEEWSAQELERAIQLSILEQQHEEQRRADQERWEQSHASSSSARYDIPISDTDSGLRRRRNADPFSDDNEMQEVSSNRSNPSILFDAGPSSRLDTFSDLTSNHGVNSVVRAHDAADHEDAELLETARSLSLTPYDEETGISDDDLMNSHHSNVYGSNLDAYSVIEPDTRPASSFTSRSHSPLIIDIDSHLHESSFHTPLAASQQDLTAASLERMQTEQASLDNRVVSPTPTLRSMTRTLEDDTFSQPTSNISPSYIGDSKTPSQAASSRPISPFSEIGNMSTHSSDHAIDFLSRRPISALSERESDKQSQWSDLGEDSSDEEEAKEIRVARLEEEEQRSLRDKRQRYFAAMSMS